MGKRKKREYAYKELSIKDMPEGFIDFMTGCDDGDLPDGAWGAVLQDSARMFYESSNRLDLLNADEDGHKGFMIYVKETAGDKQ